MCIRDREEPHRSRGGGGSRASGHGRSDVLQDARPRINHQQRRQRRKLSHDEHAGALRTKPLAQQASRAKPPPARLPKVSVSISARGRKPGSMRDAFPRAFGQSAGGDDEEEEEDEEDEGDKPVRASLARFASAFLCRLICTGCAEQPPGPFLEVRPPP